MAEHVVRLPDVGEGVAEAELVEWHVKVGDLVREDALLGAVMTDKATVEIPSPVEGEVLWLGAHVGDVVAVGSELVRLKIAGDDNAAATQDLEPSRPAAGPAEAAEPVPSPAAPAPGTGREAPAPKARPAATVERPARSMAQPSAARGTPARGREAPRLAGGPPQGAGGGDRPAPGRGDRPCGTHHP